MNWTKLIEELLTAKVTLQQIADASGMSKGAVHDLKTGRGKTVVYETGEKLVEYHKAQMRKAARKAKKEQK
jgi:predicted DNA-binding protein YlxM (UPF0122 family)